ncbi:lysozyme inhibitor LprI family protein [Microbulbifer sp. ZKSA006]|uniref:lysozyme inhibitor LprI family protein n=1 Tax=Microbulbifer sp. ZKSA006 TaxID=3243390 RepID=UPI0040390FBC
MRFIIAILLSLPTIAYCQQIGDECERHQIEGNLVCIDGVLKNPCDYATRHETSMCLKIKRDEAEKQLQEAYEAALSLIEDDNGKHKPKSSFVEAQIKWKEFREAMCNYEGNSQHLRFGQGIGMNCIISMANFRTDALKKHAIYLKSLQCGSPECHKFHNW